MASSVNCYYIWKSNDLRWCTFFVPQGVEEFQQLVLEQSSETEAAIVTNSETLHELWPDVRNRRVDCSAEQQLRELRLEG